MNHEQGSVSADLQKKLAELIKGTIKSNPFDEVPQSQIEKALELLEKYTEEHF